MHQVVVVFLALAGGLLSMVAAAQLPDWDRVGQSGGELVEVTTK